MNSLKSANRWKIKHWPTSLKILRKAQRNSEELASNQPQGDEEIAGELIALAEETTDLIEENPSFAELQDQAEEFSEQAGQTEEVLSQLAEDLASDAQDA